MKCRIDFGFGVGRTRHGKPIRLYELGVALDAIKKRAVELFGGYTLYETYGGWMSPTGKLVEENGRTLAIYCESYSYSISKVEQLHATIMTELYQEEVIVTETATERIL